MGRRAEFKGCQFSVVTGEAREHKRVNDAHEAGGIFFFLKLSNSSAAAARKTCCSVKIPAAKTHFIVSQVSAPELQQSTFEYANIEMSTH